MLTRTIWTPAQEQPVAVLAPASRSAGRKPEAPAVERTTVAYVALVVFCFLYYNRPEDFIPGLGIIPMAKISGIIALGGLIFGLMSQAAVKVPVAIKFLLALFAQLVVAIPFAYWRGGAFDVVFTKYAKIMIAALLVSMVVVTLRELRRLIWIQVSAVAVVAFASVVLNHRRDGRLEGIQKGILENPNDLALNIAMTFPLCIAFMLRASGWRKAVWLVAMGFMLVAVVLTYSRGGLLALIISGSVCVWEYAVKGKRRYILVIAGFILLLGVATVAANSQYRARVESIVLGNIEGSHDKGSLQARQALLKKSIMLTLQHPFFGIGPGNFPVIDQGWAVAHNTYTELSAESGILALVLFLLALRSAFKNMSTAKKSQKYRDDPDFRLFAQGMWAGMAAYVTGACFASTEYLLYPYMMIAYTCVMVRLSGPAVERTKETFFSRGALAGLQNPRPAVQE